MPVTSCLCGSLRGHMLLSQVVLKPAGVSHAIKADTGRCRRATSVWLEVVVATCLSVVRAAVIAKAGNVLQLPTWRGHAITDREQVDVATAVPFVDSTLCFSTEGAITGIKLFVAVAARSLEPDDCIHALVVRPRRTPNCISHEAQGCLNAGLLEQQSFVVVGRTEGLCSLQRGAARFLLERPVNVVPGDCVGWHHGARSVLRVPFSEGGHGHSRWLRETADPGPKSYLLQSEIARTYSTAVQFVPLQNHEAGCPCCSSLPQCGALEANEESDWASLSIWGVVDESLNAVRARLWQGSEGFTVQDRTEYTRHAPCTTYHFPLSCDFRMNFWLWILSASLQPSLYGLNSSDESGQRQSRAYCHGCSWDPASDVGVRFSLPSSVVGDLTVEGLDFSCEDPAHVQVWDSWVEGKSAHLCPPAHLFVHLLCLQQHVFRRRQQALGGVVERIMELLTPVDRWAGLHKTPWPMRAPAISAYLQSIQSGLISSFPLASPSFGFGREGLPTWLRRCIRPPPNSGACWSWNVAAVTDMCIYCCDPQHGPGRHRPCFDDIFTFERCCDDALQTAVDVVTEPGEQLVQDGTRHEVPPISGSSSWLVDEARITMEHLRRDLARGCARGYRFGGTLQ
mmetsp:Transcript_43474/g.139733  ORF Transcript_43474/g.139733 Transcript_43474/m.139733 type:complete len:624 (+) Transcript_43474:1239-3110(+)